MSKFKEVTKNISTELIYDAKSEADELIEELAIKNKKTKKKTTLFLTIVAITLFFSCVFLLITSLYVKQKAAADAYDQSRSNSHTETHDTIKNKIIAAGEKRYHTSNEITITIGTLKKQSLLSVLDVQDVFYYTGSDNDQIKSKAWYKVTGLAEYEINMNLADIIVDDERNYILIRIPEPTLSPGINIKTTEYNFENHCFENVADGVHLIQNVEKIAHKEIRENIISNQTYLDCAKIAAKESLVELAKTSNPNIEIDVEVEFF